MTKPKQSRLVCTQNLKEFAEGLLQRSKNGERAVFIRKHDNGAFIEVTWADVPFEGQNYAKIMKAMPETFYGVYNNKARVQDIVYDLSLKN